MSLNVIRVRGAREHNLKTSHLKFPRQDGGGDGTFWIRESSPLSTPSTPRPAAVCGEPLRLRAAILELMEKPDVDLIEGLPRDRDRAAHAVPQPRVHRGHRDEIRLPPSSVRPGWHRPIARTAAGKSTPNRPARSSRRSLRSTGKTPSFWRRWSVAGPGPTRRSLKS